MDILSKYPTPNAAGQEFVKQMCEMHGGRCSIALARELPIVAEFRQEFGPIGMQLLSMACMPFVRKSGNEIEVLPVQ